MRSTTLIRKTVFRKILHSDGIHSACTSRYVRHKARSVIGTEYKLCASRNALMSYGQLESCRKVITRIMKRQKPKGLFIQTGKVYLPWTKKSKNARMGKGKGAVHGQLFKARVYSALFLLRSVYSACVLRAAKQINKKLNMPICVAKIADYYVENNEARSTEHCVHCSDVFITRTIA